MKHRLEIVAGAIFTALGLIGLWWLISYLLIATIPNLHSPRLDSNVAALMILLMWVALLSGALLGAQASHLEKPHQHRTAFLHFRPHH